MEIPDNWFQPDACSLIATARVHNGGTCEIQYNYKDIYKYKWNKHVKNKYISKFREKKQEIPTIIGFSLAHWLPRPGCPGVWWLNHGVSKLYGDYKKYNNKLQWTSWHKFTGKEFLLANQSTQDGWSGLSNIAPKLLICLQIIWIQLQRHLNDRDRQGLLGD